MKNRRELLRTIAQTEEDRLLLAQILDKWEICQSHGYLTHTHFLDLRERSLAVQMLKELGAESGSLITGGFTDAERAVVLFLPDYLSREQAQEEAYSPLCALRAKKAPADMLTHRDYLGSLMGLQIERDCIGDILVHEDGADIVVLREMAEFLILHFDKAGRKRLTVEEIPLQELRPPVLSEEEKEANVASMRLDSVVGAMFGLSRARAQEQIAKGVVYLNQLQCFKEEKEVAEGDRITLRGSGRAQIMALTGRSRKERQFFRYRKS